MDKLWVGVPCSLVFAACTVFTRRTNIFLIVIRKQGNILLLEQLLRDGHILDCNLQARQHFGANGWRRYFHSICFQFGLLSNFISLWSRSIYYHSWNLARWGGLPGCGLLTWHGVHSRFSGLASRTKNHSSLTLHSLLQPQWANSKLIASFKVSIWHLLLMFCIGHSQRQ